MTDISGRAKERLLQLMYVLEEHEGMITSAQIEQLTGWSRDIIRKDISCLTNGGIIGGNAGYDPVLLLPLIKTALGLDRIRKFCVVGLGRLGSAYLNFTPPELGEFELVAGFDTNVNRVEMLRSKVPLYPAYKLGEVVSRFSIEIALLCVPADVTQAVAENCVTAGIRGFLNFAPVVLSLPPEVAVQNVYIADGLRSLSIKMKKEEIV